MAFETTKREVSELYAFARLLADGSVPMGSVTAEVKSSDNTSVDTPCRQVLWIDRIEHDGPRRYKLSQDKEEVHILTATKERNGRISVHPDQ